MIPQSFKDILANGDNANLFQIIAMIIFIIMFLILIWYIFTRPKKYYNEEANAPLDDDIQKPE